MSFPRYPSYKESGLQWLDEVPAHWDVVQFKKFVDIQNGSDHKQVEQVEGYPVLGSGGVFTYASEFMYDGESVLLGRKGTIDKPIHITGRFWTVDTMYWTRISLDVSGRFTYYSALNIPFDFYSTNTALPSMTKGALSSHRVTYPPLAEQTQIARFLDRETAKIDALIAEQQRLIELLQEKRQAVISHAVTKGLNPDAPMKDSGVEWLGEVPEHWDTTPMRRILIKIEQGWSPECLASPAEESEWGVVKAGCVNGGIFNPLNNKTLPSHLKPPLEYEIQAGDLLMCRASGSPDLIGSAAYIDKVRPWLLLSDKIFRLRTIERADSRYLADVLSSTPLRQQIRQSISGAVGLANNLPQSKIKDFVVPLPPAKEQDEIHEFLAAETERLKILLDESESLIRLLEERRSALISAAVTGQIDVRGLALEVAA